MDRKAISIAFASAMGAFVMTLVGWDVARWLHWSVWALSPVGLVLGAFTTWCVLEPARFRDSVAGAWKAAGEHARQKRARNDEPKSKRDWKVLWNSVLSFSTATMSTTTWGILLFFVLMMFLPGDRGEKSLVQIYGFWVALLTVSTLCVCAGVVVAILMLPVRFLYLLVMEKVGHYDLASTQMDSYENWDRAKVHPVYLLLMLLISLVRDTQELLAFLDDVLTFVAEMLMKFVWFLFLCANTSALHVALTGMAVGGTTGILCSGALIKGMLVGGAVGLLTYMLFGKEIIAARAAQRSV